jgi:hypothetical protein
MADVERVLDELAKNIRVIKEKAKEVGQSIKEEREKTRALERVRRELLITEEERTEEES